MGVFDFFRKEKETLEDKNIENLLDENKLQQVVDSVLSRVNNLIIIKAESFLDRDWYNCSKEEFDLIKEGLENNWLSLEFAAWEYSIQKTVKTSTWSNTRILRTFKFIEKKDTN